MRKDEILAEILAAKFAAADLDEELTEGFFDRLRSKDCPTAEHTVKRLKLSWAELVEMCEQPLNALRLSALRHRRADPGFVTGATPEEARWALRLVGRRLGWRPSRFDYGACRAEILAKSKRRSSGLTLPTVRQIDHALKLPFQQASHEVCGDLPQAPLAKTPEAALQLAIEASGGVLPTAAELQAFCSHNRISVTQMGAPDVFHQFSVRLEDPSTATGDRPDFAVDLPLSEHARPRQWPEPQCVHAIALYLLSLAPGQEVSETSYQQFSSRRDDLPWYRSFPQHGGFDALLPKARDLEKRMRDGFDPEPTLRERKRQRQAAGRDALWAEILDADGHPPWEPAPPFDNQRALTYLASRRSDGWCAYVVMLATEEGVQAGELVEAGLAAGQDLVKQWRRELDDLGLLEHSGRGFQVRAAGPSTFRWRLRDRELPDVIRERGNEAQVRTPKWTPALNETVRAITHLNEPGRFYPKDLAKTLSISGQNVAARLKRLEALGAVHIVERRPQERGSPSIWGLTLDGLKRVRDLKTESAGDD